MSNTTHKIWQFVRLHTHLKLYIEFLVKLGMIWIVMDPGLCLLHENVEHIRNTARREEGEDSGLISQTTAGNRAYRVRTFLSSLNSMIFHDFFYDLL